MVEIYVNPTYIGQLPPGSVILYTNSWNDYGFEVTFDLTIRNTEDSNSPNKLIDIGRLKVGRRDLAAPIWGQFTVGVTELLEEIPQPISSLPTEYFSLSDSVEFYDHLMSQDVVDPIELLVALNDVAYDLDKLEEVKAELVFKTALTRDVSLPTVREVMHRVILGEEANLSNEYSRFEARLDYLSQSPGAGQEYTPIVDFEVVEKGLLPTNLHVLIGANGVGKTTFLNHLARYFVSIGEREFDPNGVTLSGSNISKLISMSLSAVDSFDLSIVRESRSTLNKYHYVGLIKLQPWGETRVELKSHEELAQEFGEVVNFVLDESIRSRLLADALLVLAEDAVLFTDQIRQEIQKLSLNESLSEDEFREFRDRFSSGILDTFKNASSGHRSVLLMVASLVRLIEPKTVVLIDEPESHLHPPLLSLFLKALRGILEEYGSLAIMATHSPVVVQEVPDNCVWIVERVEDVTRFTRPNIPTFGENIGSLMRISFGLNSQEYGYAALLDRLVADLEIAGISGQLGNEGRARLMALLAAKEAREGEF